MNNLRTLTGAAVAVAALAAGAAPASAGSLVFTKGGDVFATSPDGAVQRQITTDGASLSAYQSPDLQDDGTVVVGRPSGQLRTFHRFALDGSPKGAPALAPGNSCGTGPLDLDAPPSGNLVIFQYIHSDFCFNPTPGNGPRQRVTAAFSDQPTASSVFPKHDNWRAPRWVPGTGYAAMVSSSGDSIGIQSGSGVTPIIAPDPGEAIESFDISRTGNRFLVETQPASNGSAPSQLELFQADGVPAAGLTGHGICELNNLASVNGEADPRWSPDGSQIAWEGAAGVYVSPAPVNNGGVCALQPRLIAAGGHDPAWGAVDLPAPNPGGGNPGGDAPGGDTPGGDTPGGDKPGDQNGDGPQAGDKTAPTLTLGGAGSGKLAKALANGYRSNVTVSEQSQVTGALLLDRRTGKKLGLPARVASGSLTAAAGKVKLVVKFTSRAKRKLKKRSSVRLSLQVSARDGAGNVSPTASRALTLKR
jgi:hypothetical protein